MGEPDPIPIVGGTGALGFGLALRLALAGRPVVIGSRSASIRPRMPPRDFRELAPDTKAEGLENGDAAKRGPIVFLTVPFRAQSESLN